MSFIPEAPVAPPIPKLATRVDDLTDHEFWLLVEPGEASEVHWWKHACFRCRKMMTVWWCAATPPWSASRPESEPLVIAAVLSASEGRPVLAYLEWRTSRPRPAGYTAFCCPHCNIIAGDFYVFEEFKKLKRAGKTNIISVSL